MALLNFLKNDSKEEGALKKRPTKGVKKNNSGSVSLVKQKKNKENSVKSGLNFSDEASLIIHSPHITEKTVFQNESGVYVFKVARRANKLLVKKAIESLYNVHIEKININVSPIKKIRVRGKIGTQSGFKKAIVFLKKGEKIEI